MEVELVERRLIKPATPSSPHRLFLSNIDLTLVAYYETVTFFPPPPEPAPFDDYCRSLYDAVGRLLVAYDFVAGRLVQAADGDRLEIDCNDAGAVVATATTAAELSELGDLRRPKPDFKKLVSFLQYEEGQELFDKPLFFLQLTKFKCGGLAMGARGMHCTLDGIAIHDFLANLAAFTRGGGGLAVRPHSDRTAYKARSPPKITHPHHEYALLDLTGCFSNLGPRRPPPASHPAHLLHLPPTRIAALKSQAGPGSSAFVAVAAKLWRAQSHLMRLPDDRPLTMLFPVDVRRRVVPPAPEGYSGNFLIPGYARAAAGAVRGMGMAELAGEVREGLERLDDEYVRSAIDWLEVNKGVPRGVDSFSVVAWSKLGLYEEEYRWGRAACFSPVVVKPGLVMLLPGEEEGGLNVCLELAPDLAQEFDLLMMDGLYMNGDIIGPTSPRVDLD